MSGTKHTPGPWIMEPSGTDAYIVRSEDYGEIVLVHDPYAREQRRLPQLAATARLIASAPDYYNATEAIRRACEINAAPVNLIAALKQLASEGEKVSLDAGLLIDLFAAHSKAEGK